MWIAECGMRNSKFEKQYTKLETRISRYEIRNPKSEIIVEGLRVGVAGG